MLMATRACGSVKDAHREMHPERWRSSPVDVEPPLAIRAFHIAAWGYFGIPEVRPAIRAAELCRRRLGHCLVQKLGGTFSHSQKAERHPEPHQNETHRDQTPEHPEKQRWTAEAIARSPEKHQHRDPDEPEDRHEQEHEKRRSTQWIHCNNAYHAHPGIPMTNPPAFSTHAALDQSSPHLPSRTLDGGRPASSNFMTS